MFLLPKPDEESVNAISARLEEDTGVASFEFVSARQAYDGFVQEYRDQPAFYEDLPVDALPGEARTASARHVIRAPGLVLVVAMRV